LSDALRSARTALADRRAWLVGGAVRDGLIGRPTTDADLVVDGDVEGAARALAAASGGTAFALSARHGHWRVVAPSAAWQADLVPLTGGSIESDLSRRDFTVNAIAEPLGGEGLVDPAGGRADLDARRLRMVSERAFDDDPLRVLRLARIAAELGFDADTATVAAARSRAARLRETAGERAFAELRRLLCSARPLEGLALMEATGATQIVLPELAALHGVSQSTYHHLDVHDHTLAVLAEVVALERDPSPLGEKASEAAAFLARPLADELTRWGAARLGALFHDAAKPQTRTEYESGRIGFPGHDERGAAMARAALERLRASERLRTHVAGLARHHLRVGFLVRHAPLARREVYGYLRACDPVEVDVTVLSVADRLATRGRKSGEAIERHLALAEGLLTEALEWQAAGPRPPLVRGDELAAALGMRPGPELGRLLAEIDEARFAGEVSTPEQAVAWARERPGS